MKTKIDIPRKEKLRNIKVLFKTIQQMLDLVH